MVVLVIIHTSSPGKLLELRWIVARTAATGSVLGALIPRFVLDGGGISAGALMLASTWLTRPTGPPTLHAMYVCVAARFALLSPA